ncbi:MAG: aminoglycoside phosphotransferase [Deltaproteobacteria bacterium RIFOXYD12_FULL_57_12]|nr:MAG: aminoglycoside phosphotransferase [Deltaproteobacteria bacterium RIFOXYD12_FULL_57_12]
MNILEKNIQQTAFHALTPDAVISLAETALGGRCTNLFRPLASYINRVYELQREDGSGLIAKFYRPGRWSGAALRDEHDFLRELAAQEIPVVAPLTLLDGTTLGCQAGMHFALFPKKGGRSFDEYNDDQWLELGRLLGRVHAVGGSRLARERITMAPDRSTREQVEYILKGVKGGFMPADLVKEYRAIAESLVREISPLFAGVELIRIHGDCHFSNLIYRPEESFFLIDFDDMAVGPPVQDFWMLLPGRREESFAEIELFLEGYETFQRFDRRTLALIEPLRAMRYIHYTAWCAHQAAEDGVCRAVPDFGSREYWRRETGDLADQLQQIRKGEESAG